MKESYVISIKRIRDYSGNPLPKEEQYWEYAQHDNYSGSFSSGYPCFGGEIHAIGFRSVEKAKEWWEHNKKDIRYAEPRFLIKYDVSTLAIRKHISIFKSVEKINPQFD